MRFRRILPASIVLVAACTPRDDKRIDGLSERDSAGVLLIDVPATVFDSLPQWTAASYMVVGAADSARISLPELPRYPLRRSDGSIVVANAGIEIRFYDSAGRFLKKVGRKGDGPGEYRQIQWLAQLDPDSLLVGDRGRVSVLDHDGNTVRSYRGGCPALTPPGIAWFPDGSAACVHGDLADVTDRATPGVRTLLDSTPLVLVRPGAAPPETLTVVPGRWWTVGRGTAWEVALAGEPQIAAGNERIVFAHGDATELTWFAPDGKPIRRVRVATERTEIPQSVIDAYERTDPDAGQARATIPLFRYAKYLPTLSALKIDALGATWMRRWSAPDDSVGTWFVFDSDGRPIARMSLPAAFGVHEIGSGTLLGIHAEADGAETVRMHRFVRR